MKSEVKIYIDCPNFEHEDECGNLKKGIYGVTEFMEMGFLSTLEMGDELIMNNI